MKKVFIALMLLVGFSSIAQRGGNSEMTPEQMATLKTKKMTLALDLNQSQQTEIKKLILENAEMRKSKRDARKESDTKPSADERFAMQNERLDYQIAHKAKMKTILNKEQYEKWEKIQMKRHRNKKNHKKGKQKDGPRR